MNRFSILFLMAFSAVAHSADQRIHRWLDDQGVVHYGQVPPSGVSSETLGDPDARAARIQSVVETSDAAGPGKTETDDSDGNDPYKGLDERTRQFLKDVDERNKAAWEAAEKADAKRSASDKECASATQRKAYLENNTARRLGTRRKDGSVARMTQEEFQARVQAATKLIDEHCT